MCRAPIIKAERIHQKRWHAFNPVAFSVIRFYWLTLAFVGPTALLEYLRRIQPF
jgi:hypothetical protein